MEVFNLEGEQDWDSENDREGFRHRATRVGDRLGARALGAGLYELPPGEKTWPYHYTYGMEEWLLVVAGAPTLRGPDGERVLRRGDVVCFPPAPEGAHQLRGPGTVLLLSASRPLEAIEYPDSGKLGVRPPGRIFRHADAAEYWEGE